MAGGTGMHSHLRKEGKQKRSDQNLHDSSSPRRAQGIIGPAPMAGHLPSRPPLLSHHDKMAERVSAPLSSLLRLP